MSAEIALRVELEQPLSESFVWVDHGEADRLPKVGGVDGDAVDTAFGVCAHRREDGAESTTRMVADFADRGTRTPAGWRLSARTITPVFEVPQA
jgi:hypothetical protein